MSYTHRVYRLALALDDLYTCPEARRIWRALCREDGVPPVAPSLDRSVGKASSLPRGCASVRVKPFLGMIVCEVCGVECVKDNGMRRFCSIDCARAFHKRKAREKSAAVRAAAVLYNEQKDFGGGASHG